LSRKVVIKGRPVPTLEDAYMNQLPPPTAKMTIERLYQEQVDAGLEPGELRDWIINYQDKSGGPRVFTQAARDFINEKAGWI